jgi:acyl-CoA reductase-like NAD-dependent aldehyde dehydrogenase
MQRDAELLAQLECLNNGKSAAVAQVMDVQLSIDFLRYMAGWATKIEGSSVDVSLPLMPNDQFHSFIRREAVGVVGAIVAWNFPLLLACWKLGPARRRNAADRAEARRTGAGSRLPRRRVQRGHRHRHHSGLRPDS